MTACGMLGWLAGTARRRPGTASVVLVVNAAEAMPFGGTAMANAYCRAGVLSQVARREERERRELLVAGGASETSMLAADHDEPIEDVFFVSLGAVQAAAAKAAPSGVGAAAMCG